MAGLENVKKEVELYQNQNVFGRLSPKQFNQVVESMNLYINKLSQKEAELNERQAKLNEKEAELRKEISDFKAVKREVELSKRQALETIRIFKEQTPTIKDTSIPDAAISRDKLIISELDKIKEEVKLLKEREKSIIGNTSYDVEITDRERYEREQRTIERRNEKNKLKARLLGIVAAYRDLLPKDQLNFLNINGKSFSVFLLEELSKIESETPEEEKDLRNYNSDISRVSKKTYDALADGYISIAKNEVVDSYAGPAYENASYYPFEFNYDSTDSRSVGYNVIERIFEGRERSLDLYGKNAKLTRSTEKMSDKPLVEQSIIDTANEFDYPFYDVEKPNKTL